MGKKWKKLWLSRKVAAVKQALQEAAGVVDETAKETKKTKSPFWKKKKDN
jgi:hypothetical protein